MLPPKNRLTKKKDFQTVFKDGKSVKNDFLLFKVAKSYAGASRFGFIVSKKISTKATQRNKIKRRLREAVSLEMEKIQNPVDVIITALPQINKKEFLDIKEKISSFFNKIKAHV